MSLESQLAKAKNDLRTAKTRFVTGWVIFGVGFLGIFASAAAMDSGAGGGAFIMMFIALAISLSGLAFGGDNGAAAQQVIDRLKSTIQNENENKELYKKELNLANVLVGTGGIDSLKKAIKILGNYDHTDTRISLELRNLEKKANIKLAGELEEHLKYKEAIEIWEELGMHKEAKRIRSKIKEEGKVKVDQTVVHGDYVDDRDTIVKDSVVNKSNIGAGGKSKAEEIKEIKELLDSGAINEDDYEKMKREIIG